MQNSKKGAEGMLWVLVVAIALLVFLFIYSGVFTKLLGKQARSLECQIDLTGKGDTDGDGIPDITDRCPHDESNEEGCEKKEQENCK